MFVSQGFIGIALDPLEKVPDIDRLDNWFMQYVNFTDEQEVKPHCEVIPVGRSSAGILALMYQVLQFKY